MPRPTLALVLAEPPPPPPTIFARRDLKGLAVVDGLYEDEDGRPLALSAEQRTALHHEEALRLACSLRLCMHCSRGGRFFREIQNVGRLECRFHPGTIVGMRYACCGLAINNAASPNSFGCVPCDHSNVQVAGAETRERWTRASCISKIPLHALALYAPDDDLVVERRAAAEPEQSWARVLRVDPIFLERYA